MKPAAKKVAPDLELDGIDEDNSYHGSRPARGARRSSQQDIAAQLITASDAGQRRRQAISYPAISLVK